MRLTALARDIKLSHSVFALPFALLGMVLAAAWASRRPSFLEVTLVLAAMVSARSAAMGMNRYADARIDAMNPRTAGRAIPTGAVTRGQMLTFTLLSAALLVGVCAVFWVVRENPWPLAGVPVVLAVLLGYSYVKRWSWACHGVLGVALGMSPLAAALAVEPGYWGEPTVWWLAGMVVCWVAGFDVIYALQDEAFDRAAGLKSIPAALGLSGALWVSRGLHAASVLMLGMAWRSSAWLGTGFALGVAGVAVLLVVEHVAAARGRFTMAFFTVNGVISLMLGGLGILDALRS